MDITLYGLDGLNKWRSYCTTQTGDSGRECIAGTEMNFDGMENARMYGAFLASGRVTMSFLDGELIPTVVAAAPQVAAAGAMDTALVPLFSDGVHLQHWPNHDNHIHVRVSEAEYTTSGTRTLPVVVFEPP